MDGYEPWTYGDAFADVYDEWYADEPSTEHAVATLAALAAAAGPGPVLELGVGTGRLAVPLAAAGFEVVGLDASPAMLDRLRARPGGDAVEAVLGDMTDPGAALDPPGRQFAVVVAACNTFFLLRSAAAQAACLAAVARLLRPGGRFAVEAFVPAPATRVEHVLEPRRVELDRVVLTVSRHEPMEQLVTGQHIELSEAGIRLRPWVVRYATPQQLDELATQAGLRLVERWGGWDRGPFDATSPVHVSVYGIQ